MTVDETTAALARFAPTVEHLTEHVTGRDIVRVNFEWRTWIAGVDFDESGGAEEIRFSSPSKDDFDEHRGSKAQTRFASPSLAACGAAERATAEAWTRRFGNREWDHTDEEDDWMSARTQLVSFRSSYSTGSCHSSEFWRPGYNPSAPVATGGAFDAVEGWRGVPWGAPVERIREALGNADVSLRDAPAWMLNGPTSPFDYRCAGPPKQQMVFEEDDREVEIDLGSGGCLLAVRVYATSWTRVCDSPTDRWGEPDEAHVESYEVWNDGRTKATLSVETVWWRSDARGPAGASCVVSERYESVGRAGPASAPARLPAGGIDLEAWVARLERFGHEEDEAGLRSALRAVHMGFDAPDPFYGESNDWCEDDRPASFGGVHVLRGQADDDPGLETAVWVTFTESEHVDEWCDELWIGVFDERGSGPEFVGAVHRTLVACAFADSVTVGFVGEAPGPEAGLWVETPEVDACGTMVSYTPKRLRLRVEDEVLVGDWIDPSSAGKTYDRITGEDYSGSADGGSR